MIRGRKVKNVSLVSACQFWARGSGGSERVRERERTERNGETEVAKIYANYLICGSNSDQCPSEF